MQNFFNEELLEVDVEQYAKAGKQKPDTGARFKIRIDKTFYITPKRYVSGKELLELAHKNPPEIFRIDMIVHGGRPKKIELEDKVDLAEPGVERFITMPLDPTEG